MLTWLISIYFTTYLFADPTLQLADSLYQQENYFAAATEYQRYLFFHSDNANSDNASKNDSLICAIQAKLILSLFYNNEDEKAQKLLNNLAFRTQNFDQKFKLLLAQHYLKENQYLKAKIELINLLSKDSLNNQTINKLLGYVSLQENDLTSAERYFSSAGDSLLIKKIYSIKKLRNKNALLAQIFSSIIPGSGEIYAGEKIIGLLSFIANSLSLYGAVYTYKKKQYLDSVILFSFFFTRFYNGSRNNARDFSLKYNKNLYRKHLSEIEGYLKNIAILN
ncbi:MAG: hypothetical protein ABIK33_03315 [candidate division WOR-3 bacterium]